MWHKRRSLRVRGFTLIEIMIVILIMGMLLIIMLPNLAKSRYQAQWSTCVQAERNLAAALENYNAQEKKYPSSLSILVSEKYINGMPTCPSNGTVYLGSYQVTAAKDLYTISCPGTHYLVLQGVLQGYPQYNPGSGTKQWDGTH